MTFTTDTQTTQALELFRSFDADTQLALLWYGYLDIKDQLTPTNDPSQHDISAALVDQITSMPQEAQLQAQRDIISRANSDISHAYTALSSSAKISFWLQLAQCMEQGSAVQVPESYELPADTDRFVELIKSLNFEQRLNFTRSAVVEMGVNS